MTGENRSHIFYFCGFHNALGQTESACAVRADDKDIVGFNSTGVFVPLKFLRLLPGNADSALRTENDPECAAGSSH